MMQQTRRRGHNAPASRARTQLTPQPARRRAAAGPEEDESYTISQMSTGTPLLDQVEAEQEEVSTLDRVIHSTILLASCLDIPFTEYIPLYGILPASIGTVLDGLDKKATYDELGDPGVGQALTDIRTAVEFAHNPVENLSIVPTVVSGAASMLGGLGWAEAAAAGTFVENTLVRPLDMADLAFTSVEGHLELAQLGWDAYQSSRLAAAGQDALAEAYAHLALDDGIDAINSMMVSANRLLGLSGIPLVGAAFTALRLIVSNTAFSEGNTQELHERMVGENYTTEPRTPRGFDAWGDTYDDQASWVEDTQAQLAPDQEAEEEEESRASPWAGLGDDLRAGLNGAAGTVSERWNAFVASLGASGAMSAVGPMEMAGLLGVGQDQLEEALQGALSAAAQSTEMLEVILIEQRSRIEQMNDGYAHLDGMLGQVDALMQRRHELKGLLEELGLPSAPLNAIDEQVAFLQDTIAAERAILDAAFGEAGILEMSLQAAYDALTAQVSELQDLLERAASMPLDIPATMAWLKEVARAMAS